MVVSLTKKPPRFLYSWQDFDNDILHITRQINNSLWIPDYIVGVKRGGLVPAIKLSHYLNKPMIMMSCQLRDNSDHEVKLLEAEKINNNSNILIVDDICDSGVTLSKIMTAFNRMGCSFVKTSCLFYNTEQDFVVDYPIRSLDRSQNKEWIVFPWEN